MFPASKISAMIDRAGYPGVAADLDMNLIESILPGMEKRAREMVAGGIPAEVTPNLQAG